MPRTDLIDWASKDAKLRQLCEQGVGFGDIARVLGVGRDTARKRWWKLQGRQPQRAKGWAASRELIRIRETVAARFGVSDAQITSRCRVREIAHARQAVAYVIRQVRPKLSYPCIGEMLGGIDHSTVMYGCLQTQHRMVRDPELAARIAALIAMFAGRLDVRQHDSHVVLWREYAHVREVERVAASARRREAQRLKAEAEAEARAALDDEYQAAIDPERRFCGQCDRSVLPREARRCSQRLCGLKAGQRQAVAA